MPISLSLVTLLRNLVCKIQISLRAQIFGLAAPPQPLCKAQCLKREIDQWKQLFHKIRINDRVWACLTSIINRWNLLSPLRILGQQLIDVKAQVLIRWDLQVRNLIKEDNSALLSMTTLHSTTRQRHNPMRIQIIWVTINRCHKEVELLLSKNKERNRTLMRKWRMNYSQSMEATRAKFLLLISIYRARIRVNMWLRASRNLKIVSFSPCKGYSKDKTLETCHRKIHTYSKDPQEKLNIPLKFFNQFHLKKVEL